ncbi:MAG: hypothetical protein QUS14_09660 [Pyrinomonadaceae bacterium]|nr:hypothetical protein [Pyrinomonadaceae bacterium]
MKQILSAVLFLSALTVSSLASDPQIWSVNSRADVLKGDSRGVSIAENGAISLSPRFTQVYKTEQPFIWSSVIDAAGNVYLGTGSEGRIFRVAPGGTGSLFADLGELNVSALAIGRGGELFAATSPDGKVYRVDQAGKAEEYFDPTAKYIWSLAVMPDGSLAVGTGDGGRIFRVRSANASPEASLLFDTSETHIITLATDKQGNLYAGTDSGGLVLRFGADGKPFALLDSPLREIHELAVGPDGSVYALAIGESTSAAAPAAAAASTEPKSVTVERSVTMAPPAPQKSKYDLTGAKSAVYRILPDGGNDLLWASTTVTGFSLYANQNGNGVLIGTSDKGRIYNVGNDGRETLVLQSDAGLISTIFAQGPNLYAASSNQGVLYKIGPDTLPEGVYESAVLDAKNTAAWGRIWWRSTGNVVIETRSGNSESPNETWSGWEPIRGNASSGMVPSPRARFFQWRAVMKSSATSALLNEVSLAFLSRNIAPEITGITMLPANVGLVPNPPPQVDPNIELSGMDPAIFGIPSQAIPPRRVYQRGAVAFQWTAEDRNDDKLVYDVFYREVSESAFKLLRQDIEETFVSIDGLSLADGRYVLKIVAKDSRSNPVGQSLSGERISEPFDIDNTQPTISLAGQAQVTGDRVRAAFTASDRSGYIVRAEYSINGGPWKAVFAEDGISDGPEERYTVDATLPAAGEYTVTLRVFDSVGNVGSARVVVRR